MSVQWRGGHGPVDMSRSNKSEWMTWQLCTGNYLPVRECVDTLTRRTREECEVPSPTSCNMISLNGTKTHTQTVIIYTFSIFKWGLGRGKAEGTVWLVCWKERWFLSTCLQCCTVHLLVDRRRQMTSADDAEAPQTTLPATCRALNSPTNDSSGGNIEKECKAISS